MPWVLGAPTLGRTGELWQEKALISVQKPTLHSFSADLTGQQERILSACHPEPDTRAGILMAGRSPEGIGNLKTECE